MSNRLDRATSNPAPLNVQIHHWRNRARKVATAALSVALPAAILYAADQTWSGGASGNNTAWYTASNWVGGSAPGSGSLTTNVDTATIPTTGTTNATIGINGGTNATLYLGAINFTGASRAIGNSSATSFTLRLNGTTVNSLPNVILRNSGTGTFTLRDNGGGAGLMGIALGNATTNVVSIEGAGGITISSIVKDGAGSNALTLSGAGTGVLTLSGANTYTGGTTVAAGTLAVANSTGSGTGTGAVTVGNNTGVATLSGTGTISGLVMMATTGSNVAHLAPGVNVAGTNFGGLGTLTLSGGFRSARAVPWISTWDRARTS